MMVQVATCHIQHSRHSHMHGRGSPCSCYPLFYMPSNHHHDIADTPAGASFRGAARISRSVVLRKAAVAGIGLSLPTRPCSTASPCPWSAAADSGHIQGRYVSVCPWPVSLPRAGSPCRHELGGCCAVTACAIRSMKRHNCTPNVSIGGGPPED